MNVAGQAPQSMGFSRQEYWNGLPCHLPGDLPDLGIRLASLMSPALAGRFFTTESPEEIYIYIYIYIYTHTHTHIYTFVYVCVYVYTYMCVYTKGKNM